MSAAEQLQVILEEYLAMEEVAQEKHELFNGVVYAMAGASPIHNTIVFNLIVAIGNALRGRTCHGYPSDLKVQAGDNCFYPDATIVCGEDQLRGDKDKDDRKSVLQNPTVIFEVLSASTAEFDYGEKFVAYRKIESLRDYVLIAQDQARVDHFTRQSDETWNLRTHSMGEYVKLKSADIELAVDEIYERTSER